MTIFYFKYIFLNILPYFIQQASTLARPITPNLLFGCSALIAASPRRLRLACGVPGGELA
jgi:hypothetical protein